MIALVDQYILSQSWTEDIYISDFYGGSSCYTGHYIVICGYDAPTDEFEIRDPASSSFETENIGVEGQFRRDYWKKLANPLIHLENADI